MIEDLNSINGFHYYQPNKPKEKEKREFCTEMVRLKIKKKKDKINSQGKVLMKLVRNVVDGNGGN